MPAAKPCRSRMRAAEASLHRWMRSARPNGDSVAVAAGPRMSLTGTTDSEPPIAIHCKMRTLSITNYSVYSVLFIPSGNARRHCTQMH